MEQLREYLRDFVVLRETISYSEIGNKIFEDLYLTYGNTFHSALLDVEIQKDLSSSLNVAPEKLQEIIMESLTAHRSRKNYVEKINEHLKSESDKNFKLINLIFGGKDI